MRLAWAAIILLFVRVASTDAADAQTPSTANPAAGSASASDAAPLPDPRTLLLDVERNDRRLQALRKDYTYHVHLDEQELNKDGSVKKTEITDSESMTLDGVRVDRVIARNGRPLTPDEQRKENDRLDKDVAKARERQAKATGKGQPTDDRGDTILSAARILELGDFSHERRVLLNGRPTIVLDYAGNADAKTHSEAEGMVRDLVGTVWVDEADHVLVRGQGHFLNDFKIGGGLVASVRKGSSFAFEATHVADGVWLPAHIQGRGDLRVLLFVSFHGRLDLLASDYRRFRTGATILGVRQAGNASPSPPSPVSPSRDATPVAMDHGRGNTAAPSSLPK